MKKNKKINLFKITFYIFFLSFVIIYFSELTGYYEYQNHNKAVLTSEQIKKFENDVKNGNELDINDYIETNKPNYENKLSKLTAKLSDTTSNLVQKGVEYTFNFIFRMMDE